MHPSHELLRAFVDGKLDDEESSRIEQHLSECPRCEEILNAAESSDSSLVDLIRESSASDLQQSKTIALDSTSNPNSGPHDFTVPAISNTSKRDSTNQRERYEIQSEIARGGMGAVHRARDHQIGRDLAVKVLLEQHVDRADIVDRFVEEAQISGQLQHPGIAPIYELGWMDEKPFFSMKLVKGKTMAAMLADRQDTQEWKTQVLHVFESVCQTVAYAHSRGVIHRDLKPSNVMVGAFGEVQVMDWGLAKVMADSELSTSYANQRISTSSVVRTVRSEERDDGSSVTKTRVGSMMGTPAYMAPEQAVGDIHVVNERTDVFGLGAILCEILTGKPAYAGETAAETIERAVQADLSDAEQRLDGCGADAPLISLARRCLDAHPEQRPLHAGMVADEMQHYFGGVEARLREAELARTEANAYAAEAVRRRKLYLALASTLSVLLVSTIAVALIFRYQRELQQAMAETIRTEANEVKRQKHAAEENFVAAEKASQSRRRLLYASDAQLAPLFWASPDTTASKLDELLTRHIPEPGEEDLRSFEWYYHFGLLHGSNSISIPGVIDFQLDDQLLITVTRDGEVEHRDLTTGEVTDRWEFKSSFEKIACWAIDPVHQRIAVANSSGVFVLDAPDGQIAYKFDATAITDQQFDSPHYLQFSPDFTHLMAIAGPRIKKAIWWDLATGNEVPVPVHPENPLPSLYQWVPEVNRIAKIEGSNKADLGVYYLNDQRDKATEKKGLQRLPGGSASRLAISRDGRWGGISYRLNGEVTLLHMKQMRAAGHLELQRSSIEAIDFSDDSTLMATGGTNGNIIIWPLKELVDQPKPSRGRILKGHVEAIRDVRFSSDGSRLVSLSASGLRIWDLRMESDLSETVTDVEGRCYSIAYSRDGKWFASSDDETSTVTIRDASSFEENFTIKLPRPGGSYSVAFSPDNQQIAIGQEKCYVSVWDLQTQRQVATLDHENRRLVAASLAFSPDGKQLAVGYARSSGHNTAIPRRPTIWDISTQQIDRTLQQHENASPCICYDSSGSRLYAASHAGRVYAFDPTTGVEAVTFDAPWTGDINWMQSVNSICLSSDDRLLAMATTGGTVSLWDTQSGERIHLLLGHSGTVNSVAFSPDNRTLASASNDRTIRLWNIATGREMMRLSRARQYQSVTFSVDGTRLLAGSGSFVGEQHAIDLWHAPRNKDDSDEDVIRPDAEAPATTTEQ